MFNNLPHHLCFTCCWWTNESCWKIFTGIKICLEIQWNDISLKSSWTILSLLDRYKAELSVVLMDRPFRENHYPLNHYWRLAFFLHTLLLYWCTLQKKCLWVRLFLPTWKLVQIRGKFSHEVEGILHEQINTQSSSSPNQHYHAMKQDARSSELYSLMSDTL